MPSDKNNYIVIIRDPSPFKQSFPFSNPLRNDESMNRKVTPLLLAPTLLNDSGNKRFTGFFGFHPHLKPQLNPNAVSEINQIWPVSSICIDGAMLKILALCVSWFARKLRDRRTDRQTDRRTDRQTRR